MSDDRRQHIVETRFSVYRMTKRLVVGVLYQLDWLYYGTCTVGVDVLREQYVNLATELDAHSVAVRMYQRNALTLKELQSIQCLRDRTVQAAETLLNIIMEQPYAVYLCFLDVLKHTGQQLIYEILIECSYKGTYS